MLDLNKKTGDSLYAADINKMVDEINKKAESIEFKTINGQSIEGAGNIELVTDVTWGDINDKPELFDGDYDNLSNKPELLKGDKGDAFIYEDFTPEELIALKGVKGDNGNSDLSIGSKTATNFNIISLDGNEITLPAVSITEAGLATAADKLKIETIINKIGGTGTTGTLPKFSSNGQISDSGIKENVFGNIGINCEAVTYAQLRVIASLGVAYGLDVTSSGNGNVFRFDDGAYLHMSNNGLIKANSGYIFGTITPHYTSLTTDNKDRLKVSANGDIEVYNTFKFGQFTDGTEPAYQKGAQYFNTTTNKMRVGGATNWVEEGGNNSEQQIEISSSTTALESWNNNVVLVSGNIKITLPNTLSSNWSVRIIVLEGTVYLEKPITKNWLMGNEVPFMEKDSIFSITQQNGTNNILIYGNIICNPFVSNYDTRLTNGGSTADDTLEIPFVSNSSEPIIIDWGDGNVEYHNGYTYKTHVYLVKGKKKVKIYGNRFSFVYVYNSDRTKITTVNNFGNLILLSRVFNSCGNLDLKIVKDTPKLETVTDLSYLFDGCYSLGKINNINSWDVKAVVDMAGMFNSSGFLGDISSWDTRNVTNMSQMFASTEYNAPMDRWDVSKVTNMSLMFEGNNSFNQNLNKWNVGNVTNMSQMFKRARGFNNNISSWNVGNVTNMSQMFDSCNFFNGDISAWDVSKVTNMYAMFNDMINFNQNLNSWDVSKVTNMYAMFNSSPKFNGDISAWDVSNVTDMTAMFNSYATAFNRNLGSWNIGNVISIDAFLAIATPSTFSVANLDSIYNGWSSRPVKPNLSINFGSAKYSSASAAGRLILTSAPNNWTIIDGGQI